MPITLNGDSGITTPTYGGTDTSEYLVPVTGFKNRIINGAMGIWQRGTTLSSAGTGAYLVDRWQNTIIGTSLNLTMSQDTSVPNINYLYSLKFQQLTSNATSVVEYAARQRFELANVRDLAGNNITISFWYRSNVTGTHGVRILPQGTTGGIDTAVTITVNAANTWEYKTVTTTALSAITSWGSTADNALALILDIGFVVGGQATKTINTNDYFNVTGVQLEKGSTATSFDYRPYGQELALCQRYFQIGLSGASGRWNNSTTAEVAYSFRTQMRAAPTVTHLSNYSASEIGVAGRTITNTTISGITEYGGLINIISSGATTGSIAGVTGSGAGFSAEL